LPSARAGIDFINPTLVSPPLECCLQEHFYHGLGRNFLHESGRYGDDVGIVMLSGQGCKLLCPTQRTAHTLVLVGGDGYPVATAANQDPPICMATLHRLGYQVRYIGVIHRVCGMGAEILHHVPLLLEQGNQTDFVVKPGVVRSDGYFHEQVDCTILPKDRDYCIYCARPPVVHTEQAVYLHKTALPIRFTHPEQ
jgi:hypothetical protein